MRFVTAEGRIRLEPEALPAIGDDLVSSSLFRTWPVTVDGRPVQDVLEGPNDYIVVERDGTKSRWSR